MSKEDREKALAEIAENGAVIGKSLKLSDGCVTINGEEFECSGITYDTKDIDGVGMVLGIHAGDTSYVFLKKKGIGGLFGLSMDIQDFTDGIEKNIKISKERIEREEQEAKERAELEARINEFENDTYTLYDRGPDGFLLKKGEKIALWSSGVEFHQIKTHTSAVATGGSIRIAKGVNWRIGGATPVSREYLAHMDTGRLVITNQKLSFMGDNKSVNISINKIVDVSVYRDAFEVSKESVMKKYVFMVDNPALWASCIEAMNRRLNQ